MADDQFINIEVLRSHLIEFEDKFNIDYLYNGDRALRKAQNIIEQALIRTGGNVSKTAQLLRLQRTTLIQKMNKLKRDGDGAFQPENPLL